MDSCIIFLLDEDGKHPEPIAAGAESEMRDVFDNLVDEYNTGDIERLHLRRVIHPKSIWASTSPI